MNKEITELVNLNQLYAEHSARIRSLRDSEINLPMRRLDELFKRVHRGARMMRFRYRSSAWIMEALQPDFTVETLFASRMMEVNSYFFSIYTKLELPMTADPSRMSPQVFYGLNLELGCKEVEMNYRALDFFWLQEALEAAEPFLVRS